jgi:hypothetical protein
LSNADKRRILDAADRCTKPGEIGALMRRHDDFQVGSGSKHLVAAMKKAEEQA